MRSIKEILETGSGWITETELDWLCNRVSELERELAEARYRAANLELRNVQLEADLDAIGKKNAQMQFELAEAKATIANERASFHHERNRFTIKLDNVKQERNRLRDTLQSLI